MAGHCSVLSAGNILDVAGQSQCAAPKVGRDLECFTFWTTEGDQACWGDYEIKLGEEEGQEAVVDWCHMLFIKAAASAELLSR